MAHLKLFIPHLSNSNGIFNMLIAYSSLASINYNNQDQNLDLSLDQNIFLNSLLNFKLNDYEV
jgi:hypothetical protein